MPELLDRLMGCAPHNWGAKLPNDIPLRGVYVFSKAGRHFYVGRTDRLKARFREHGTGRNNDAPFAFKMARHATGHVKAKGGKRRNDLEADPIFAEAFDKAKRDVRGMEWRWVQIDDPNEQCLFEIYATIALKAEFNDFENH